MSAAGRLLHTVGWFRIYRAEEATLRTYLVRGPVHSYRAFRTERAALRWTKAVMLILEDLLS